MAAKRMLWRDIRRTFSKSRARFFSIVALIALGCFALVGFKVTGPDMRATAERYFDGLHLCDLTVIADMGIDDDDAAQIARASDIDTLEFDYLVDVTYAGTTDAVRVFSAPHEISEFELVDGHMPAAAGEAALDVEAAGDHPIGSTVTFEERPTDDGSTSLTVHEFTVVGYVDSPEIIGVSNRGATQAGTGSLTGYAVVPEDVFDVDYHMIARLSFADTAGLDPYGQTYLDRVTAHKDELDELLAGQPEHRLEAVRAQYQDAIDEGQEKVDDARARLDDAAAQLEDAAAQIADAHQQIADSEGELADAKQQLADGRAELDASWSTLLSSKAQLDQARATLSASEIRLAAAADQLAEGRAQLTDKQAEYDAGHAQYEEARDEAATQAAAAQEQIDAARATLEEGRAAYEETLAGLESQAVEATAALKTVEATIGQLDGELASLDPDTPEYAELAARRAQLARQYDELQAGLEQLAAAQQQAQAAYDTFMNVDADAESAGEDGGYTACMVQVDAQQAELDEQVAAAEEQLAPIKQQLDEAAAQLAQAQETIDARQAEYDAGYAAYAAGVASYNDGLNRYYSGLASWNEAAALLEQKTGAYEDGVARIADARAELADKEAEYEDGLAAYNEQVPEVEDEIAQGEADLAEARTTLAELEKPAYHVYNRRETPGSEGYVVYDSVSEIVDSLADIFPYFLYLVAALVASTTMARMVNEERVNSGTLKALGYSNVDIMKKFLVYGATAALAGAVVGIAAGHTLLPLIVYNAYAHGFTVPQLELHFSLSATLLALVLSLATAVVPAWIAAARELREKPAELLLPRAPASGSKVLLERVGPVWRRLSFIRKVTVRNLFRYKSRALMTILGVAGAAGMLFTGFAVQNSISGIVDTQFGEIIGYDLIVAEETHVSDAEREGIEELLDSEDVVAHSSIRYDAVTKRAGNKGDEQDITVLVSDGTDDFAEYLHLHERTGGRELALDDDGAIISERIATLTGTQVGDTFTFTDAEGVERSVRVSGICEMYMNHFMFMTPVVYEEVFGKTAEPNAYVATLADASLAGTADMAARFMALPGVEGVVQSTALINMVDIIVAALDKIMVILIVIATLLAVVILYNLVTVNVSERIRELSTVKVLGFHDNEVAMYIYRETIALSVIGIPCGWAFGRFLQLYIINAVPPETVMFNPAPGWLCFAVSAAVILAVVFVLYFAVKRRLRHVDMLEALKSVD